MWPESRQRHLLYLFWNIFLPDKNNQINPFNQARLYLIDEYQCRVTGCIIMRWPTNLSSYLTRHVNHGCDSRKRMLKLGESSDGHLKISLPIFKWLECLHYQPRLPLLDLSLGYRHSMDRNELFVIFTWTLPNKFPPRFQFLLQQLHPVFGLHSK